MKTIFKKIWEFLVLVMLCLMWIPGTVIFPLFWFVSKINNELRRGTNEKDNYHIDTFYSSLCSDIRDAYLTCFKSIDVARVELNDGNAKFVDAKNNVKVYGERIDNKVVMKPGYRLCQMNVVKVTKE